MLVAAVFVAVVVALAITDARFGPEDDPWVTLGAVGLPLVVGLAIGRSWALLLAFCALLYYAINQDTGELAAWWAITALMTMLAVPLGIGVLIRQLGERLWRRRARAVHE